LVLILPDMLTTEEKRFIEYWQQNRSRKKKWLWQLSAGLPLGVALAAAIMINFFSGWYKKAAVEMKTDASVIPIILIGLLAIVAFIIIFSSYHKWEMYEQRYRELKARNEE
jgi:hypothetical protein